MRRGRWWSQLASPSPLRGMRSTWSCRRSRYRRRHSLTAGAHGAVVQRTAAPAPFVFACASRGPRSQVERVARLSLPRVLLRCDVEGCLLPTVSRSALSPVALVAVAVAGWASTWRAARRATSTSCCTHDGNVPRRRRKFIARSQHFIMHTLKSGSRRRAPLPCQILSVWTGAPVVSRACGGCCCGLWV